MYSMRQLAQYFTSSTSHTSMLHTSIPSPAVLYYVLCLTPYYFRVIRAMQSIMHSLLLPLQMHILTAIFIFIFSHLPSPLASHPPTHPPLFSHLISQ